jgi:uncharacterized NAD(P)/FAD-binding protein YdhS
MTVVPSNFPNRQQSLDANSLFKIAIVGRGFTGLMTSIALLKAITRPFHLVMYDPQQTVDISTGASQSATILNSRVRDLSLNPSMRDDFGRWIETSAKRPSGDGNVDTSLDQSFVTGELFGIYVHQRFSEALQDRTDVVVQICPQIVNSIDHSDDEGFEISFGESQSSWFDAVFLATGYGLHEQTVEGSPTQPGGNAVVIGAGVRAVDRALRLLADSHAEHVTLISSSGFLPQSHTRSAVGTVASAEPLPSTLRGAFHHLRLSAQVANSDGSGWQGIMNGFRLRAHDLWQGLSAAERGRFKRHVKAIYDSHRNRLPPGHYKRLHQAINRGAITVRKGKVERIATNGVLLSGRNGLEVLVAGRTIDCRSRPTDLNSPLFHSVLRRGLAKRDEVELGILVDRSGRVVTAPDVFLGLFAMGPLGLGSLPDIDLVPEIVIQARAAALALEQWVTKITERVNATADSL